MKKTRKRYPINFREPDFCTKRLLEGIKKSDIKRVLRDAKKLDINNSNISFLKFFSIFNPTH